jgi:hypothetical protein
LARHHGLHMTLATKNGSLIVKDGQIAENCGCCGDCVDVNFFTSDLLGKGCGGAGVQHGLRTIEIPQRFSLPREVHISGVVDDDLSIDGSVVQGGQYVTPLFPQCNPAHLVCYSFTATNRTFTVAAIDNHGGNTSYTLRICFSTLGAGGACCEGTTCSVKPQCQCQGAGKVFKGVGTVCAGNPCVCASTCIPTSVQSLTLTISGYEGQWRPQTITLNGSYSLQRLPSNPCIWYWSGYENTNCSSKQSFASSFWDGTNASGVNHRVGFRLAQNSFAWYMIDTVDLNCCGAYCTDRSGCNYIGFGGNGLVSGTTTPVLDAICSSPVSQVNAAGSVYGAVCGTSFLHYFQWTVAINPLP